MRNVVIGAIATAATFLGTALIASAIVGVSPEEQHGNHEGGPATPRQQVASGSLPHLGDWELLASETVDGEACLGLRYTAASPAGVGGLSEACGSATNGQIGNLSFPRAQSDRTKSTVFFGRAPDGAASIRVEAGSGSRSARTFVGSDGATYAVFEHPGVVPEVHVVAVDRRGQDMGRVDPAAVDRRG